MDNKIRTKAKRLAARRRLKMVMAKIAVAMSCIAVFCVVYILVTPGVTAEWPLQCELEEHIHDESCYEEQLVEPAPELVCGLEEGGHVHDESCYTQVQDELICTETGTEEAPHEHGESCYSWTQELTCGLEEGGHVHDESCYTQAEAHMEKVLICGKEEHSHSEGCYIVPEDKKVYNCGYLTEHTHSEDCYFENGELKCNIPEHLHTEECLATPVNITLDESFRYETDISTIDFRISGEASYLEAPADPEMPEEDQAPEAPALEFDVTLSEDQAEYDAYEDLVSEDGDVLAMQILNFALHYGGQELDLSGCEIVAELTPTEMLVDYAENGADMTALGLTAELGEEAETPDMGLMLAASGSDDGSYEAALINEDTGTVTVPITGKTLRTAAISGENPKFTVQYYAMLSRVTQTKPATGTYDALTVIDTSSTGTGTGGKLPQNGTPPKTTNIYYKDFAISGPNLM